MNISNSRKCSRNREFLLLLVVFLAWIGCHPALDQAPKHLRGHSHNPSQDPLFHFNPKEVTEITLLKSDPLQNTPWFSSIQKSQSTWILSSVLPETALIDRQADTNFIEHLLDSFGSLQITSPAPHGSLESFGLNPPAFAFRWKTATHSYELRLGSLVKTQGGNHIERYMTLDGISVHIASGTTLRLIEQIQSIQSLRKKEWTTLDADDIDEIEIFRPALHPFGAKTKAKRALFAQMEGDRWTNQQHQALSADISSFLIFLSGSPVLQFVDSKTQVRQILNHLPQAYEVKLTDRSGKKTSLSLWLQGQKVYGRNSTRPEGVFQLNPKVLSALTALSAPPDR